MIDNDRFLTRLSSQIPVLLDGPMGTELNRRGFDTALPLWSAWALLRSPDAVREIHIDHLRAGAEVLTTNTFRTHRRSLQKAGYGSRARELTELAVELAREAIAREPSAGADTCFVAGSVSPLEDCYSPHLTPRPKELEGEHEEMARHLTEAGVDLLLVETMPTIREALAATRVAVATGRPVLVGFTCDTRGQLVSGEAVADAAAAIEALGATALLINCTPAHALHRALERLAGATQLPIGAYGNVGHSEDDQGWSVTDNLDATGYAERARGWIEMGARLVGCCCGTTPEHLRAVAALIGS